MTSALFHVDGTRILVITCLAFLVSISVTILVLYVKTWLKNPSLTSNKLIALHVWLVSISYLCFLVGASLEIWMRLGDPFSYRIPLYAVGFLCGVVGLYVVAKVQARKAR